MNDVQPEKLDTLYRVETPEGVDLVLREAGPLPRLAAWLLDSTLRVLLLFIAWIGLSIMGQAGMGLLLILLFALEWLYPILFEVLFDGSTPGKYVLGLRVLRFDGTPIDWTSSVIRNLLRVADFLPVLNVAGLISMLFAGQFRRLGDMAAGTVVVYRRNLEVSADLPLVRPEPPPVSLRLDEQRALVSFAHRGPQLSRARAEELAGLAAPLAAPRSLSGSDLARFLYAVAAWLIGRRPEADPKGGR